MKRNRNLCRFLIALLLLGAPLLAETQKTVEWTGRDTAGREIVIPHAEHPTVIIFFRPDQPQSRLKLQQAQAVLDEQAQAQVVLVISGRQTDAQARTQAPAGQNWPVVIDPDYALSGASGVHVWPTTLVVAPDGRETAHLAGLGKSFAADLRAHLEYAAGRIDAEELQQRLANRQVVTENHVAVRHLQVAQHHLERGRIEQARAELAVALRMLPEEAAGRLTAARLMTGLGQPAEALALLDQIDPTAAPAWHVNVVRARALVALGRWAEAGSLLPETMRLNPNPSEVHYLQGLVHQHEGNSAAAAESFRNAFELAVPNQKLPAN